MQWSWSQDYYKEDMRWHEVITKYEEMAPMASSISECTVRRARIAVHLR